MNRVRGLGPVHRYFRQRSGMEWYDGLYAEIFTSFHMRKSAPSIYHFLFAERDYRYLPALRPERKHKVIGTFHAAPREFARVMKRTYHIQSLDAASVGAKNLGPLLEPIVGKDKLFFVPHGVDTDYFTPSSKEHFPSKTCLCVGHHHRDFETLAKTASWIRKKDAGVRFIVVDRVFSLYFTREEQRKIMESFTSAGNIEMQTNLSDAQLLELYQTSAMMVLPLFEATANVALLEALSCGLPIVTSDMEGIRDYVSRNEAVLVPERDPEAMAKHVLNLLEERDQLQKLSQASRKRALAFDWRVIAEQIKDVYHTLPG